MKKLIALMILVTLVASGCKFFKKNKLFSKGEETMLDTIQTDTTSYDLSSVETEANLSADSLNNLIQENPYFSEKKAYMIVGSFMIPQNADRYAEKIRAMGYNTEIIVAGNGFHMVAANGYDNLRDGVRDISKYRNEINEKAWVYLRK